MKFGVLGSQTLVKIIFKRVQLGTVPPRLVSAPPISTSASPHVTPASTSPLKHPAAESIAKSRFACSFPSSRRTEFPAEPRNPSPAARRAGADSGHPSPPCLDSPRPKPRDLAPKLLHPFPSSAAPKPGRMGLPTAGCHHRTRRASPSPSNSPLRPPSAQIKPTVSFPAAYSCYLTCSPSISGTALAGAQPRRRGCHAAAALPSRAAAVRARALP